MSCKPRKAKTPVQSIVDALGVTVPLATGRPWKIVVQVRSGLSANPKKKHVVIQCWTQGFACVFDMDRVERHGSVQSDEVEHLTRLLFDATVNAWEKSNA